MSIVVKLVAAALVLMAIGVPVIETWEALFLGAIFMALVFGVSRPGWRRLAAAGVVVLAVVGLKDLLPRADIAEAHNAFLVIHDGEALQGGLPAEVFRNWRAQFDTLYPPQPEPYDAKRSPWRATGVPKTLFVPSSDAIWKKAKYSRQVDAINFRTLGEFRGGFANEGQYNFWTGELLREWMPFYVMYELTPASVGSRLVWRGQLFWERADGAFDEIVHDSVEGRAIAPEDAGKRVYAVFFPKRDEELSFRLEPSLQLRLAGWADVLLTAVAGISVLALTVRPAWGAYLRALSIFSAGYVVMASFIAISAGKYLGRAYPPQGGGDDGMVQDGWGRLMAMLAGRGEIVEGLKGFEAVYWFTPGTRYLRMVEKLIFGDTNHLYALLLPCILIVIFYLIRHFVGSRWAWAITGIVCVIPVGNLSFLQYMANAKLGYGEAVAGGLFLVALVLLLHTQPALGGTARSLPLVWGAAAALALSMFIRPNFAFAVIWLGAAHAWASWRRKDLGSIAALAFGLMVALWMPFHNWFYGGEFYLISKSGTYVLSLGVGDYVSALGDLLRGRLDSDAVAVTSEQLKGWLWDPGFVIQPRLRPLAWAAHGIRLLALIVTSWVAFRGIVGGFAQRTDLAIVAVAAICAHVPMLFAGMTHFRYAMLAWDLSLVVLIASLVRLPRRVPRPHADLSPV